MLLDQVRENQDARSEDRSATVRKSRSRAMCGFASRRDLLLSVGRRPRLADLYAEVARVRGESFRAD